MRALQRGGFVVDRQTGSHVVMYHPDRPEVTIPVPVHANRDLRRGTLASILRDAGLSVEEFLRLLED